MFRKNGELQECDWDEALDFVADGLKDVLSKSGPESLAFLGSSKCTNEENYLFQKLARALFGTNNIDNGGRLHSGRSLKALAQSLPYGAMTNPLQDLEDSDVILVIGSNPSESYPVAGYKIKRAVSQKGAKLILIDPRRTGLSSFGAVRVPVRPETDGVLINGFLKGLLASEAWDKNFVKENTAGLSELKDSLGPFSPEYVEEVTGCAPALFESILGLLKDAARLAVVFGSGITQQPMAEEIIKALANLVTLKGSLGKKGGGIYPLDKENNGQGAWDMGSMPDRLPGYRSFDDQEAIQRFEKKWKRALPKRPGIGAVEMILGAETGAIKAMYIMGENPSCAFPDSSRVERALLNLDFLVVQDVFLTKTAKFAHAVLPACSFAEKDGTFTNTERRLQRVQKAIDPLHHSRPDWEILCGLSERMGYPMNYGGSNQGGSKEEAFIGPVRRKALMGMSGSTAESFKITGRAFCLRLNFRLLRLRRAILFFLLGDLHSIIFAGEPDRSNRSASRPSLALDLLR
jgi:predicted molibdopterin-dependent oxidoreductase YjgC